MIPIGKWERKRETWSLGDGSVYTRHFVYKPANLSLICGTHMKVEGQNRPLKVDP